MPSRACGLGSERNSDRARLRGTTRGVRGSSRRRGLGQAGIASKSLRFGAATHAACRLILARSGIPRARSRLAGVARRATQREDELRESDGREIGRRRRSQRAWLLARAVMKPEAIAAARRKSGRCERTRTEAAASRGGGSRARTGVPVRRRTYGRSWMFGSWPYRSVTRRLAARRTGVAWAGASPVGTPRADQN
jgi:hypothetical protein